RSHLVYVLYPASACFSVTSVGFSLYSWLHQLVPAAFWDVSSFPGVVVPCRAVGVLQIEQNRGGKSNQHIRNDRILGIPESAKRFDMKSVYSLPRRLRDELGHFFIAATAFEGKDPKIIGWGGV